MINTVVLQGRMTKDPEQRTTPSGTPVCSFSIACDRSYVKAGAERKTDFFNIVAWYKTAEFVARNFRKGQMIGVTGHLQMNEYVDHDGNNRKVVDVYADSVDFMGDRSQPRAEVEPTPAPVEPAAPTQETFDAFDIDDADDLPF